MRACEGVGGWCGQQNTWEEGGPEAEAQSAARCARCKQQQGCPETGGGHVCGAGSRGIKRVGSADDSECGWWAMGAWVVGVWACG